jgi:threonine dehydrogenase-like Zn-dependent dehydrogenase
MNHVARPVIGDASALLRVHACGVCGTDLHILNGDWPTRLVWPFTLGHEVAGVIEEIGPRFESDFVGLPLVPGSKVIIPPLMACGQCRYCLHYPSRQNKCLNPTYYGRYIPFATPPHLWGGWADAVYLDLELFPATKVYRVPDNMSLKLASLAEPLTSCIRALNRAVRDPMSADGFSIGSTVVVQGSGPIGLLTLVAAKEMGAGRVIVVGAPEYPRLDICRQFGADATVSLEEHETPAKRIEAVRALVDGFGADVAIECAGHSSTGPEGIEMLRDGGTYIVMGQFTDAGPIMTNWHRICTKDLTISGSWAFTPNDIPLAIGLLERCADRYPWGLMQTEFDLSVDGVWAALESARSMECIKATIIP